MKTKPRKRKSNNPAGRPSAGLAEARFSGNAPAELMAKVFAAAAEQGISAGQWYREAFELKLTVAAFAKKQAEATRAPIAGGVLPDATSRFG